MAEPTITEPSMADPSTVRHRLPDRNLGLDLMRGTEAAALAAARWIGRGDKDSGDRAAVDAMRYVFSSIPMRGSVVIGEGALGRDGPWLRILRRLACREVVSAPFSRWRSASRSGVRVSRR